MRPDAPRQTPCGQCGLVHERCIAHRRDGGPCRQHPVRGSDVCDMHGGSAPQVKAAADRGWIDGERVMMALAAIRRELAKVDPDPVDPIAALMQQLALAHAWERYLRAEVAELDQLYYLAKVVGVDQDGEGQAVHEAKPHVALVLWNQERDRLSKFAKLALDAGLEERQVRLAEEQGAFVAALIRKVFDDADLGLSPVQRRAAAKIAARHLRIAAAS